MTRALPALAAVLVLVACATVRQEDLASWEGEPVQALDMHPVFLTMQQMRTRAADGTEIRNYVNGVNLASCSSGGVISGAPHASFATYDGFTSCMGRFAACNNIFYIKGGKVVRYTPVGSGGARCFTDSRTRPQFRGATNF